ncbi:hypothetical protein JVU11DRAFT_5998 [Chiua virens]|nr:hypothetical protein JVU11DRAFT_5998 [Chiua virens]
MSVNSTLSQYTKLLLGQQACSGQQTADVSWWPKQSTWESSDLNVGYWSTDNEAWYQKPLQKICEYNEKGKPSYHSASDWQKALKYCKDATKKACNYATQAAEHWLINHM